MCRITSLVNLKSTHPSIRENENPRSTESEQEVSSERDPYDGPRVSPTPVLPRPTPIIVQPNPRGPRIRQTARKSDPIPIQATLRLERPEAPEPPRIVTGMLIGRVFGMPWAEEQHLRAMTTKIHGCQMRMTHQNHVLTKLVELTHQLTHMLTQALEGARMARRMARRAELACVVAGVVLLPLALGSLFGAHSGWY